MAGRRYEERYHQGAKFQTADSGVTNGWTQPIINRINMLSTGIRTDVGVKLYGQNLDSINLFAQQIKTALKRDRRRQRPVC